MAILCRACADADGLELPAIGSGKAIRVDVQPAKYVPNMNQTGGGAIHAALLEHPLCIFHYEEWSFHRSMAHYRSCPDEAPPKVMAPRILGGGLLDPRTGEIDHAVHR